MVSRRSIRTYRRRAFFEALESRLMLKAAPFGHNLLQPMDVNRDAHVSPLDVLIVINDLNRQAIEQNAAGATVPGLFLDVNGDESVSPVDALIVVNSLNDPSPVIAATLPHDSAPVDDLASQFDLLTNDYRLALNVSVADRAARPVEMRVGAANAFVDITSDFNANGAELDAQDVDRIFGGDLPDGDHQVTVRIPDQSEIQFVLTVDRDAPIPTPSVNDIERVAPSAVELAFAEAVQMNNSTTPLVEVKTTAGEAVAADPIEFTETNIRLPLQNKLPDAAFDLVFAGGIQDLAGNTAQAFTRRFTVADPTGIASMSPADGEEMVSLTRETIIRFDEPVDPSTVTADAFNILGGGQSIAGRIRVSSTERFATLFYDRPLPASTQFRVTVDGSKIMGRDGLPLDANGDNQAGGLKSIQFSTISSTRIANTNVVGRVIASEPDEEGNDVPLEGVTIRVDGLPEAHVITNAIGEFKLTDVPAFEFFIHIDGTTVTKERGVPIRDTGRYPNVGKVFKSIPGETLVKDFDIYLPFVLNEAFAEVIPDQETVVTLPDVQVQADPAMEQVELRVPANSLLRADGSLANEVAVFRVDSDRLPGPLPPALDHEFDITIQAEPGAFFDVPAPISFPNSEGLEVGEKSFLMSFDHAVGKWIVVGTMTAIDRNGDGVAESVETDNGVGVLAPGWHGQQRGTATSTNTPRGSGGTRNGDGGDGCNTACVVLDVAEAASNIPPRVGPILNPLPPTLNLGVTTLQQTNNVLQGVNSAVSNAFQNNRNRTNQSAGEDDDPVIRAVIEATQGLFKQSIDVLGSLNRQLDNATDNILSEYYLAFDEPVIEFFADLESKLLAFPDGPDASSTQLLLHDVRQVADLLDVYDSYRALMNEFWGNSDLVFGDYSFQQRIMGAEVLESLVDATSPDSAGGHVVTPEEVESSKNLPAVPHISHDQIQSIAQRINNTFNSYLAGISSHQQAGRTDFIDLDRTKTQTERLISNLNREVNQGIESLPQLLNERFGGFRQTIDEWAENHLEAFEDSHHVLIESADGQIFRFHTSEVGTVNEFILAPESDYTISWLQRETLQVAKTQFRSGVSGSFTRVGAAILVDSDGIDSDADQLPDVVERILGTALDSSDTDGDGLTDFLEFSQRLDPLGGRAFPTGIIATLPLNGNVADVAVTTANANDDTPIVVTATRAVGIATIDSSRFDRPIVQGQLALAGDSQSVAVDSFSSIAVVAAGPGGLHFVDVSDPVQPRLLHTAGITATHVEVQAGIAYAVANQQILAFDVLSGVLVKQNPMPGGPPTGLAIQGDTLFSMDSTDVVRSYRLDDYVVTSIGETQLPAGAGKISVSGDVLYAAAKNGDRGGYSTLDISDPANMTLISAPDIASPFIGPGTSLVPNGSGLGLLLGSAGGQRMIDLMNVVDPQETNELVTRFQPGAIPSDGTIASGIGYVAAGNSLHVVNYVGFDNQGTAPGVTISGPAGDSIEEGTSVPIRVNVTDDVQVRDVELLVNGSVVQRDNSAPFDLRGIAPAITEAIDRVTFQVRTTDTGGNATLSDPLTYTLTEDLTGPVLLGTNLNPQSVGVDLSSIVLIFDQAIDATTLDFTKFQLLDVTTNLPVGLQAIRLQDNRRVVVEFADALNDGQYQLQVQPEAVSDIAGNATTEILIDFENVKSVAGVNHWIGGDGNWSEVFNWSKLRLPNSEENVAVGSSFRKPTVHVDVDATIAGGLIHGQLTTAQGRTLSVTGSLELPDATVVSRLSLVLRDGQAFLAPKLASFTGSSARLEGSAMFNAASLTSIDQSQFVLTSGAQYVLPSTVTSFTYFGTERKNKAIFSADGDGTRLDLSSLDTVSVQYSLGRDLFREFASTNGAVIDLSGATNITGGGNPVVVKDGPFVLRAESGGQILLDNLQQLNGTGTRIRLAFSQTDITLPELMSVAGVIFSLPENGSFTAPKLTELRNSDITLTDGQAFTAAASTVFETNSVSLNGTGQLTTGDLTSINNSQFVLTGGAQYVLPSTVTSYSSNGFTRNGNAIFSADGDGTRLDLSPLETVTVQYSLGGLGISFREFVSSNGGVVDLSGTTNITGGGNVAFPDGPLTLRTETSGQILLDNLQQLIGTGTRIRLSLSQTDITLPELTTVSGVIFNLPDDGSFTAPKLAEVRNSDITLTDGQAFAAPASTIFETNSVSLNGAGQLTTGDLTSINHSQFVLTAGAQYQLPSSVTSYTSSGHARGSNAIFAADGDGTRLDLSSLASITMQYSLGTFGQVGFREFVATNGGMVDLSGTTTITGGGNTFFPDGPLTLRTETNGQILLDNLQQLSGTGTRIRLSLSQTDITLPELTTVSGVIFSLPENGSFTAPKLTEIRNSDFTLTDGQAFTAAASTVFETNSVSLNGSGLLTTGDLTSIDNSQFVLTGGAQYVLPSTVTSYYSSGFARNINSIFSADGDGTLLDLSSLNTITVQYYIIGDPTRFRKIVAANHGIVDLSGATIVTGGGVTRDGPLTLRTEADGQILLDNLQQFNGTGTGIRLALSQTDITLPELTTVSRVIFNLPENGSFTAPKLTEIRNSDFTNNGSLTLGSAVTLTDSSVRLGSTAILSTVDLTVGADSVIAGSGTVNANLVNDGLLIAEVGSLLTVNGDYTQSAVGVLRVAITSTASNDDFGRLIITGQANLGGSLVVALASGFVPNADESFIPLEYANSTDSFATLSAENLPANLRLETLLLGTEMQILFTL